VQPNRPRKPHFYYQFAPLNHRTLEANKVKVKMPNQSLKRLLFVQGGQCFFCNLPLPDNDASVEHLVAKAKGGSDHDGNCVATCKSLNRLLGSKSLKEKIQVVLNQKGQFQCPNGTQRKATKKGQPALQKATKLGPDYYAQLVANLKQRGSAKPRTVPKLKSTIAALFQNKLSTDQVNTLVQQLQSRRVISVAESKVTYNGVAASSSPLN
jgi:hypothetical protein